MASISCMMCIKANQPCRCGTRTGQAGCKTADVLLNISDNYILVAWLIPLSLLAKGIMSGKRSGCRLRSRLGAFLQRRWNREEKALRFWRWVLCCEGDCIGVMMFAGAVLHGADLRGYKMLQVTRRK